MSTTCRQLVAGSTRRCRNPVGPTQSVCHVHGGTPTSRVVASRSAMTSTAVADTDPMAATSAAAGPSALVTAAMMALSDGDAAVVRAAKTRAEATGEDPGAVAASWATARADTRKILGGPDEAVFVHFTTHEDAQRIAAERSLGTSLRHVDTVFAVAAGGEHVPGVQRGTESDWGFGRIRGARDWAVVFTTGSTPETCVPEEVIWHRAAALPLHDAEVVPADEAVSLLDGSAGIPDF